MPDVVRTVGRYGIVRELGRGGMAVVYLAQQVDLDRLVALKELAAFHAADPSFAQRFVRESRLAGSLVHPNVITVFDYFEHAGTPYIAMEYVERGSLRPYVGRMTLAQIGGVPTVVPVAVTKAPVSAACVAFAIPKSAIFTPPAPVTMRFSGLRSRCTIACCSASASPASNPSRTPPICASVMRPTYGRKEPRSTYSIAM